MLDAGAGSGAGWMVDTEAVLTDVCGLVGGAFTEDAGAEIATTGEFSVVTGNAVLAGKGTEGLGIPAGVAAADVVLAVVGTD